MLKSGGIRFSAPCFEATTVLMRKKTFENRSFPE
jgi:hypothetical protein